MNILVLGGNGFIGSHLTRSLVEAGHTVRVFDRVSNDVPPLKGVDYRQGTLSDTFALAESLQEVELVYHLISTTVPGTSNLDPVADIEDNLIASVRLFQTMIDKKVNKLVFLSSGGTVYGNPRTIPVPESHPRNPICSYGIVKSSVESYLNMYRELYGFESIILRPSNPYGPMQGHVGVQGIISTFLQRVYRDETLYVWGDGSVERDYLYISDLVDLCAMTAGKFSQGTYNVGSGESHSIQQILALIEDIVDRKVKIEYKPSRSFDVKKVTLDIEKVKTEFNWSPRIDIRSGIESHWEWIRSQ